MDKPILAPDSSPQKYQDIGVSTPNRAEAEGDASVDFSAIWTTIHRSKWLILFTCLLVTAAVTGYTLTLPKVYESTAMVSVEPNQNVESASAAVFPGNEGIDLSKEIGLLENSGELNRRVVKRLSSIADTADAEFTIFEPEEGEEPTTRDIVGRLRDQTEFTGQSEQAIIEIRATSESPREAAFIVNAYAEEYQDFSQEMARAGVTAARKFLEEQVQKRKQEIRNIENEWESFARSNNVPTDGETGERVANDFVELQQKRDELQFQLEQEQRMKSILESQLEEMQPALRSSVMTEQRAQSLRTQIQTIEEQLSELKMKAGEYYMNNPDLRGNEEQVPELAELKRRIEGYEEQKANLTEKLVALTEKQGELPSASDGEDGSAGTLGQVESLKQRIQKRELTIKQLEGQIEGLDQKLAEYEGQIDNIPRQRIRRQQIQRRLKQAEQFHQDLVARLQETIITEESELGYVTVVRAGVVPQLPVSPDMTQNVLLGIILGLGFGIGLAFIVQSVNTRLHEPEDIQEDGFNLLGVVPRMDEEIESAFDGDESVEVVGKRLSTTLLPLLNPWSPVAENYRLMRTSLEYPNIGEDGEEPPQVLLVTSPEAGDGKTTTAANLAITFALSGQKVLLIDSDLRRPNLHNLIGLDAEPGLAEVLAGQTSFENAKQSFIENLTFLSAGKSDVPPTEMLDSEGMHTVLRQAREQADVVILDTPPVLAASDAVVLGVQSDATLVVADAGKTDRQALRKVEKTFGAVGVPVSAVIFNRFSVGSEYDYGYPDEYYEPEGDPTPKVTA